ncbi:MAG: SlyX family protein [Deltaproteobacteria bacterium]|nr:SlyX family protein [Deltaproteobacteria bacterium]
MEDRLTELETRVAFQDDALRKLRDVASAQEQQIYRLTKELERLRASVVALAPSLLGGTDDEGPPPHY